MLTKLLPDQISKFWDVISYALDQAPPVTISNPEDWKNKILASAMSGKISVWASYLREDEKTKFEGLALTSIQHDNLLMTNSLLIYYIYGYEKVSEESYIKGLITLIKQAKKLNCINIIAYTTDEKVKDIVTKLGGEASVTLITFDIDRCLNYLINLGDQDA